MPRQRGQSILEYLLVFAVVSAAVYGMQVYAKRGVQAIVKTAADQMSPVADDADGQKAQILGMRLESQELDDGTKKTRKQIVVGRVLKKDAFFKTNTSQKYTMEETVGGGHGTKVADETTSTGHSTSEVISKVKE